MIVRKLVLRHKVDIWVQQVQAHKLAAAATIDDTLSVKNNVMVSYIPDAWAMANSTQATSYDYTLQDNLSDVVASQPATPQVFTGVW